MRRKVAIFGAVAILLAVSSFFFLHSSPVRARALALLVSRLAAAGIVANAERLDYNLRTLEVDLRGLTLTSQLAASPFLTAEQAHVVLGWGVLFGRIDIDRIELVHPRVSLIRDANGTQNWPRSTTTEPTSAPPMVAHLGRVHISNLEVSFDDRQAALGLDVTGLSLDFIETNGATGGPLTLTRPVRLRWRDRSTAISRVEGRLSWNGRDLAFETVRADLPEVTMRVKGAVRSLLGSPSYDLQMAVATNLRAAAPWFELSDRLDGTVEAEARIGGTLAAPEVSIEATGRDIAFDRLPSMGFRGALNVSGDTANVTAFTANVADGTLTGRARLSLGGGPGTLHAEWQNIGLASLIRSAIESPRLVAAAQTTGTVDAQWSALDLEHLRVRAEGQLIGQKGSAETLPGTRPVGQLPLDGSVTLQVDALSWALDARPIVGRSLSGAARLRGRLNETNLARSSIEGQLQVEPFDIGQVARLLTGAGLVSLPAMGGTARADFDVKGAIGSPLLEGNLSARDIQYESIRNATLTARARVSEDEVRLDEILAEVRESVARGHITLSSGSGRLAGHLDWSLPDLSAWSDLVPVATPLSGRLDLSADLSGSTATPQVSGGVTGFNLAGAGQTFDRLDAEARIVGDVVRIEPLRLTSSDGQVDASGAFDLKRRTYETHITVNNFQIRPVPGQRDDQSIPLGGRLNGEFAGGGSFSNLGGRGNLSLSDLRWGDLDLGRVDADVALSGRNLSTDIRAIDLGLAANGLVSVDNQGPFSLRGRWDTGDVADLWRRLEPDASLEMGGAAAIRFESTGTRDRLAEAIATLDLERLDLEIDGQPVHLAQPARVEYARRTARADDIQLTSGTSSLMVTGAISDRPTERLSARLEGSLADFAFVRRLAGMPAIDLKAASTEISGDIDLQIDATGPLERPAVSGLLTVNAGRVPVKDEAVVTDLGLSARFDNGVLSLETAKALFQGASVVASGRVPSGLFLDRLPAGLRQLIPAASGPGALRAQFSSITPQLAAPFVDPATLEQLAGHIDASIDLEADRAALERVRGTITLTRGELALSGVPLDQRAPTRLVVHNGRIDVASLEWGRDENHLTVGGGLALTGDRALALTLDAETDLRLLNAFTRVVRASGRTDAKIRVGGTLEEPTLDGLLTLNNADLSLAYPRLVVSNLTGTTTLASDTLTLNRLTAMVNGGDAELTGTVRHRRLIPIDGRITIRDRQSALDLSGLRAEADADLVLTIEPHEAVVSGTVTLVRSAYREPLSLTTGLLQTLRSSSRLAAQAQSGGPRPIRLDVRLVTQDDLLIDNNYADVAMSGNLRLVGTAEQPAVTGRATLAEGGLVFFGGNRYRLSEPASIEFVDPARIDPDITLRAVTQVGETEITLALVGRLTTLQPSLTSNPPLPQSDLVSLLVTGRTAADAAAAGFAPGSEEILGYLSGELFTTAGRALGIDTVRVERGTPGVRFDAGLIATETDPAARLTFGKNIRRNLEVVLSQSLRQSGGLTWIVSYIPRKSIEVRTVSLDNGDRLYDFRHDIAFGPATSGSETRAAPRPRVNVVDIQGAGADEETLRRRLRLSPGDRFTFFDWQRDRERLEAFYHERKQLEARITTRRVMTESNGEPAVSLSYSVRPGPRTTLTIEGFSFAGRVVAEMEQAWTNAVIDELLAEEVTTIAKGELADRGFVLPTVSVAFDTDERANEKHVRVRVDPGRQVSHRELDFHGNERLSQEELRAAISTPELARAVWLDSEHIRVALLSLYRRTGYLNAVIDVRPVTVDGDTAKRRIDVQEGDAFQIRDITIVGTRAQSAATVRETSGLSTGSPFSDAAIERGRNAIDASYRQRGFNDVAVTLQALAVPDAKQIDVLVNIEEGRRQRLSDIQTSGVNRTNPGLISRALKLDVGEPVNLADWYSARRRLYETGVFRSVDIEPERVEPAGPGPQPAAEDSTDQLIRAKVSVTEWPRMRLRYGLEVNDERVTGGSTSRSFSPEPSGQSSRTFGAGLASDFRIVNLFGRAVSSGVAARYTRDFRAVRTYLTSPSLFGLAVTSNAFVSRSREQLGEASLTSRHFVTDKTDITLEQRVRPFGRLELSYRYALERNHTFDLNPDPLNPLPFDVKVTIARLASTMLVDTRDDLVDASRGWFHSSDFEYGVSALGSDLRFVKYLLQQRYYRGIDRMVIAASARVGLATAFDQVLIPSERFFAGGGNSVRGYAEDALSPRDVFGDTVGGNALLVLNGEVRFPIYKRIGGVGFLDAGRAFERVGDLGLLDLSLGSGFGLRVQTPVVLLRVDYGIPLDSGITPRTGRWFFSVGQAF